MNYIIDFIKQNGNQFETLEINMTKIKSRLKLQQKDLAIYYYPDKNLNTKERFIKIKKHINLQLTIQKQFINMQYRSQEQKKMISKQKQYADVKKRRELFPVKRDRDNQKKNKENFKNISINRNKKNQFNLSYKIKIFIGDQKYNKDLFKLLFKNYVTIQEIKIKDNKIKSIITFHTTEADNNAVIQQNNEYFESKTFYQIKKEIVYSEVIIYREGVNKQK
ncbi:unnamed protein product [Paramecium pentaurelia]|uniref:Uncharacterized protein n=1 Tax=Paramecium pentaurelia TaxID=43138 RepID=A0A8S1XVK8_9CILI|nr:unnamed protein product [Paramecium pentaurelia]